jgi:hypothetical protein
MVLSLSMLDRRSRLAFKLCLDFFIMAAAPVVGDDRSPAVSLSFERFGDPGLRIADLFRAGDGFPTVLSTSVTSPISESIVPLP